MTTRRPWGVVALALFFTFGTVMSGLTASALIAPGHWAGELWRLNPSARTGFQAMGSWAVPLMLVVAVACAGAAIGLWRGKRWGQQLTIGVLSVNLLGDLANGVLRGDWRTLIGVPTGGAMLAYLLSRRIRAHFSAPADQRVQPTGLSSKEAQVSEHGSNRRS